MVPLDGAALCATAGRRITRKPGETSTGSNKVAEQGRIKGGDHPQKSWIWKKKKGGGGRSDEHLLPGGNISKNVVVRFEGEEEKRERDADGGREAERQGGYPWVWVWM